MPVYSTVKEKTSALDYFFAFAASLAVIAIRYALHPLLGTDAPLSLLLIAPLISALYGSRAVLLSTGMCLLGGWILFIKPMNSMEIIEFGDLLRMLVFAVAGYCISQLAGFRRRTRNSLQASRQRQELAVDAADLGVFEWDIDEDVGIWENDRMYQILGYTRQNGRLSRNEFLETCLHRHDVAQFKMALRKGMIPGTKFHAVCRIIRKLDQKVRLIEFSGKFLFDADKIPRKLLGVARDITDQKAREDVAVATHKRLQTLLDNVPAYIYQIDRDGCFEFVNRAYSELVGHNADALVGQHVTAIFPPDDAAVFIKHNDAIFRTPEIVDFEEKAWFCNAMHVYSSIKTPLFDDRGEPVSILGISTDITERNRIEQALRDSDRRKDEFLAVLGHELRNPLAPLSAGIELLEQTAGDPDRVADIRAMMHRQVTHLVRLVDDLLNMSRISRGQVELQFSHIDLNLVMQAALEQVRPVLDSRRHVLTLQLESSPLPALGDFDRLTQVIVNLLTNAAKFTPPGGRITLSSCADGDFATLRVHDNGLGIPEADLQSIFEMFTQVHEHKQHMGGEGLGIGLALSRQFVALHKGTIAVHSEGLGKGSEFTVQLPLNDVQIDVPGRAAVVPENAQRRVLVVDDNEDAALSLCALLDLKGHVTRAVHSGRAALDSLVDYQPEIILMDIGMPGMDGYEAARLVRTQPGGKAIRLIALTGWGQKGDRLKASAAGFDEHLTKPVDTALLWSLLVRDEKAAVAEPAI